MMTTQLAGWPHSHLDPVLAATTHLPERAALKPPGLFFFGPFFGRGRLERMEVAFSLQLGSLAFSGRENYPEGSTHLWNTIWLSAFKVRKYGDLVYCVDFGEFWVSLPSFLPLLSLIMGALQVYCLPLHVCFMHTNFRF